MSLLLPCGVHIVGSAPFLDAEETLRVLSAQLGRHLKSIADGETNDGRNNWVACQYATFAHAPQISNPFWSKLEMPTQFDPDNLLTPEQVVSHLGELDTQYDKWAIDSYRLFSRLRNEGMIPQHLKFQVCIPMPLSVLFVLVAPPYRATVEPVYEAALVKALRNIQDNIPHEDLLIQFDVACEFALLEGVHNQEENAYGFKSEMQPWFNDARQGTIDRLVRLIGGRHVDNDVDIGIHLCYGDFMGMHFVQPKDATILVHVSKILLNELERKIAYIHMPVPKPRTDDAFYQPLKDIRQLLHQNGTHLYLGLIHPDDHVGSEMRIQAAKKVLGDKGWGVSYECGLGRLTKEEVSSFCEIATSLTSPWKTANGQPLPN